MSTSSIVLLALGLLALSWAVGAYRRLKRQHRHCRVTMEPVPELLERRHQLIAPLVEAMRPLLPDARQALEDVIACTNAASAALADLRRHPLEPAAADRSGQAEHALDNALAPLGDALRDLPPGVEHAELQRLLHEVRKAEESIGIALTVYNHAAADYNASRADFPSVIVAFIFAFRPVGLLHAAAADSPVST